MYNVIYVYVAKCLFTLRSRFVPLRLKILFSHARYFNEW